MQPQAYGQAASTHQGSGVLHPDASAAFLTDKLRRQEPFLFIRYGDGALECINGGLLGRGYTCDGEQYSAELGRGMQQAWDTATSQGKPWKYGEPAVYVGDWLSADFGSDPSTQYRAEYARLIGDAKLLWLHFGCLLLSRESPELLDFYRAVKADGRRKLYLGPAVHAPAARALGCEHIVTPMDNLFSRVNDYADVLGKLDFDLLLWGAGMAGTIPVVRTWEKHPERTYINLGSALDPLTRSSSDPRGYTRSGQLTPERARAFFRELL